MNKVEKLRKGSCKGKTAAIVSMTTQVSFKSKGIKNVIIGIYKQYLEKYCGYDKVYICCTNKNYRKVDQEYFNIDDIIFDIDKENILIDLEVDDVFDCQNALIFYGGVVQNSYFSLCNRLLEWYKVHGDGHYFTIQDDPEFLTINPARYIEQRLEKNNIKFKETEDSKRYLAMRETPDFDLLNQCFDETIVAHCGANYETYYNARTRLNISTSFITEPKWWDTFNVYTWQGVNCNLEEKFKDYPLPRQFKSEYHGYVKHDLPRIKTTVAFYNGLDTKIKLIQGKAPFSRSEKYVFENAQIFGEVKYNELFEAVAKDAYTTFITANSSAFNDFISPRYFDSMLSDIVTFVYIKYDENKTYTNDKELKEFMYVDTPEDFKAKVERVANDEKYYRHIKYLQRKSVYDKFNDFMLDESKAAFEKYLKENEGYLVYIE